MDDPVFILGTGRCGTTIFFQMFVEHGGIAWLSSVLDWEPKALSLNRWYLKLIDMPLIGQRLQRQLKPSEAYRLWNRFEPKFAQPRQDLTAQDVTLEAKRGFRHVAEYTRTASRPRFVAKFTGWPRIGYLLEIFPRAKFVIIQRDGRAVANSFMNVPWWSGHQSPDKWRWGPLDEYYQALWDKHDRSLSALAAIQWLILTDAFLDAVVDISSDNVFILRYSQFCDNPLQAFHQVLDFCGLPWEDDFQEKLGRYSIKSTDDKWQKELSRR
jgi:hypothetical protein